MMTFADSDCGIEEPHRHTGEIVEGYFIEYWCPTATAWMTGEDSFGIKCVCIDPHMRARIQWTSTEIIEILDPADYDVVAWLKRELKERFWCRLMEGEEAYNRKYGNDTNHSSTHVSVRDGVDDPSESSIESQTRSDRDDSPKR